MGGAECLFPNRGVIISLAILCNPRNCLYSSACTSSNVLTCIKLPRMVTPVSNNFFTANLKKMKLLDIHNYRPEQSQFVFLVVLLLEWYSQ